MQKQAEIFSADTGVSYGIVELDPSHLEAAKVLIERADSNMYKQKTAEKKVALV